MINFYWNFALGHSPRIEWFSYTHAGYIAFNKIAGVLSATFLKVYSPINLWNYSSSKNLPPINLKIRALMVNWNMKVVYETWHKTIFLLLFDYRPVWQLNSNQQASGIRSVPVGSYMFKVNNRNIRTRCEVYAELTITRMTPLASACNFIEEKTLAQLFSY